MNWLYKYHLLLLIQFIHNVSTFKRDVLIVDSGTSKHPTSEVPKPIAPLEFEELDAGYKTGRKLNLRVWKTSKSRKPSMIDIALQVAAKEGIDAMTNLYQNIEPEIAKNGHILEENHPAALLSKFSAPAEGSEQSAMAAFATITATKAFRRNYKESTVLGRQAQTQKVSFRRTPLEGLCPPREPPTCMPASQRYRTHDGTCNNRRRPRWGSAQMPFNRFLPPEYGDGIDSIRGSVEGGPLSSARFVSLLVHGAREGDAPLTLMIAQWGQLLDHDLTSTAQPRSINGSVPSCCGSKDFHPSCFPIKVPLDDPWLAPLKVRCLEFLRSAPAQRRDCVLSWREQTNQVTSFVDASPIYSSNAKTSDNARIFRNGLLIYGRGNPAEDVCMRGALAHQCIRSGDGRSGEQPGLLALHHVWVGEHNRIAMELSTINPHWSDEKVYQETRRIIGALFQHITYREFLPIVLGREVCKLFDIDLLNSGYYTGYDPNTNPSVSNSFAAAAFRFGHSLVQNSYMRCDRHHNFINNNVSLHEEFQQGDIGTAGSLHRLVRGLAAQKALKRDEFITPELTNHLFQTPGFPFGLDLAAINIQRGRDHGIAPYTAWRQPCGLTAITSWDDLANVVGPESAKRISHAYRNVHDIDLFVGGIAERPVVGGLVGPTFACIIAQQFSNSRKGDRFWYENPGFESSFTPAQLHSLRHVSLSSILCRAVSGGTLQPHVFIPSDVTGNQRVECGQDPLAPIDLGPWLEQDPFLMTIEKIESPISQDVPLPAPMAVQLIKEEKGISNRVHNITMVTHVDFIPNGSIGFHRVPNMTKIHDKLDMAQKLVTRPIHKPFEGVNNKLDKGRLPNKKLPKPTAAMLVKRPSTTTRRTVIIHNVEIELRSAAKVQKNKKKKADRDIQKDIASAAQNTIMKVAGVVRSQMNAAIEALEPRTVDDDEDYDSTTDTSTEQQIMMNDQPASSETVTDYMTTTKEPLDTTDLNETDSPTETIIETITEEANASQTDMTTEEPTFEDDSASTLRTPTTDNSSQSYKDFQAIIDSALQDPTDEHVRVHRSPGYKHFRVRGVELTTHLGFADKLRTLKLDRPTPFTGRQLTSNLFDIPLEAKIDNLEQPDFQNTTKLDSNVTRTDHRTTDHPATLRNVELRQYHDRPIYNRPQKLILDGPNSDQYEIEINIRQTNAKPLPGSANYVDYNNPHKRYDTDRYANEQQNAYDYPPTSSTSGNNYYTQATRAPYGTRTKPPTIIYLNEHDDRTTTTRPSGFFQNIISFATNGFNGNKQQGNEQATSSPFQHTPNRVTHGGNGYDTGAHSPTSSNYLNSPQAQSYPQSKPTSGNYLSSQQVQSYQESKPSSGNYLSAQQAYPPPQGFPQQGPGNFNPVGGIPHGLPPPQVYPPQGLPGANSFSTASNLGGVSHASSSAVSTGHFGAIVGSATSVGSDSTFSFNIRPSSRPQPNLVSPNGIRPNYELVPPRRSQFSSTPSYANPPKPISTSESFHYPPNRQDPFSSHTRRPRPPYYNERPTNIYDPSYDELGRSDLKINKNGHIEAKTNGTREDDDSGEYDYNDDDDDDTSSDSDNDVDEEEPAKKFDKDGYLRPEHMAANLYKQTSTNKTKLNATQLDDNFVLPVLRQNDKFIETHDPVNVTNATNTTTKDFPDIEPKSFANDILAEDYDELLTARSSFLAARSAGRAEKRKRPAINLQVAFAPINILTKPERPDNWVIFDTPEEKPLLPGLPDYNTETMVAAEVPSPFDELRLPKVMPTTTAAPKTTQAAVTSEIADANETTTDDTTTLGTLTNEQTTIQDDATTDAITDEPTTVTDGMEEEQDTMTTTDKPQDGTTVNDWYTEKEDMEVSNNTTEITPNMTDPTTEDPTNAVTELLTDQRTDSLTDRPTDIQQTEVNLT